MDEQPESSSPATEPVETDTDYACFVKAKDNGESTFTLRAQDQSAPDVIDFWAAKNALVLGNEHPKIVQARQIAARMRVFPGRRQAD